MNLRTSLLAFIISLLFACGVQQNVSEYHITRTVSLPGEGGWDYVAVDGIARRVYVSHTSQVAVLDADSGKLLDTITGLYGVHGIAIAVEEGRGFITNGKADKVTIFDLKTLELVGEVKTGSKPDSIIYDPYTHRVFAFNGESNNVTVIDAATGKKAGTIGLKGAPEFAAADGKGHVFVNLEDKSELLKLDAKHMKVLKRWSVSPGESPSSLAMDQQNNRLFIGCRNRLLLVMNAVNGKVVASFPISEGVDATAFDRQTKQVISSTSAGNLSIIQQETPDRYHVAGTIITKRGSRTFGLDEKSHTLFVPTAEFSATPPATAKNPKPRPAIVPGTFKILILEK